MLGHNGITSRRWRFSAYVDPSITKSCFNCAIKRLELLYENAEISNSNCMVCCDWNFNHVKMAMKKPADYPTEQHPDSPLPPTGREVQNIDYLYPIELSYDIMKAGVQFCFFNCYHGMWTKTSALSYLKSLCINENMVMSMFIKSHPAAKKLSILIILPFMTILYTQCCGSQE